VDAEQRFWTARLRWRLRGAWMWPAFVALTVVDGVLLHLLPPVRLGLTEEGMTLPFAIIVATFGNLFLVGAVAPWIARRLAARAEHAPQGAVAAMPPGVRLDALRDRTGAVLLVLGLVGVLAAGLGSREVVVSDTNATTENAHVVKRYVERSGNPELIRNLDTADTIRLAKGYFRTCIALDDRSRHFCMFVDTNKKPAELKLDPSGVPNSDFRMP
jgi:hypothetical protein